MRSALAVELSQLRDHVQVGLVALLLERGLEIGDERVPEREVRLRASHDLVEGAPRGGQLLRGLHPARGGGRKYSQERAEPLFVVSALPGHLTARRRGPVVSSLESLTKLNET